jgi:hypothetical protein
VNERAVNIKQNEPHHPETLPESEDFRENIQDGCRIAGPGSAGAPLAGGSGTGSARRRRSCAWDGDGEWR